MTRFGRVCAVIGTYVVFNVALGVATSSTKKLIKKIRDNKAKKSKKEP